MDVWIKVFQMSLKFGTRAIDKYTFRKEVGKDPLEALEDIAHEVGLLAEKCCDGTICENNIEYARAREAAIYLASSLRERIASNFISESIKGVVNFFLYSLKRKFVPGTSEYESCADYNSNDRINEFLKNLLAHDRQNLKKYRYGYQYFHRDTFLF